MNLSSYPQLESFTKSIILTKVVEKNRMSQMFCVCARRIRKDDEQRWQVLKCVDISYALQALCVWCIFPALFYLNPMRPAIL